MTQQPEAMRSQKLQQRQGPGPIVLLGMQGQVGDLLWSVESSEWKEQAGEEYRFSSRKWCPLGSPS